MCICMWQKWKSTSSHASTPARSSWSTVNVLGASQVLLIVLTVLISKLWEQTLRRRQKSLLKLSDQGRRYSTKLKFSWLTSFGGEGDKNSKPLHRVRWWTPTAPKVSRSALPVTCEPGNRVLPHRRSAVTLSCFPGRKNSPEPQAAVACSQEKNDQFSQRSRIRYRVCSSRGFICLSLELRCWCFLGSVSSL